MGLAELHRTTPHSKIIFSLHLNWFEQDGICFLTLANELATCATVKILIHCPCIMGMYRLPVDPPRHKILRQPLAKMPEQKY
jgi:hypothetical protein